VIAISRLSTLFVIFLLSGCLVNPHDREDFENFYNTSVDLTGNLVFYHFNEDAYTGVAGDVIDAAGSGNDSNSVNTPIKTQGIYGEGVGCTGNNGISIVPAIFDNAFNERTISVWFRADSTNGVQAIYEEGGTVNGIVIYIDNGILYGGTYKRTGADYDIFLPFPVKANIWYNVAIRFQTTNGFELFINGIKVGGPVALGLDMPPHSDDNGICFQNNDTRRHTGSFNGSGQSNFFRGVIDELAVWNRSLSDSEVVNLFNRQGRL